MSCNCNNSYYSSTCCPDTPYPQVSHESVPSLIDNLVNALYGTINKTVVDGRVVWNIPCDPNNTAEIDGFPRLPDEGLLCYIIRYFDVLAPSLINAVTINGTQTITGQKTFTLPVLGDAVNNTLAQTITGNKTFNWIKLPVGTTATRPTGQTGLVRFNTDRNQFEGYNNTTWSGIGDQPVGGGTNRVFFENDIAMTDNYTITSGKNAMSAGPITVNPGVVLTIPSGSTYTIV
jgi:hypothetical protein